MRISLGNSTTLRAAAALVGVSGAVALAGCSESPSTSPQSTGTQSAATQSEQSAQSEQATQATPATTKYTDGTYTVDSSFQTPDTVETMTVTVTIADDVITAVEVGGTMQAHDSQRYQTQFIGGISAVAVGVPLDGLTVSRVAGASLNSDGFNLALDTIRSDAAV